MICVVFNNLTATENKYISMLVDKLIFLINVLPVIIQIKHIPIISRYILHGVY